MRPADIVRLLILAAIWGGSFIFIRVLSPVIGPVPTAASRVLIGGVAIIAYAALRRNAAQLSRFGAAYVIIGIVNSAIPFVLFGFAALHLPASYLGILNSATPLFATLLAAVWLDEPLTRAKLAGMACGVAGVALVSKAGPVVPDAMFGWAIAASLGAAFCYAAAGIYLRKRASDAPAMAVAGWSQLAAAAVLMPIVFAAPMVSPWPAWRDPAVLGNVLALGLVCSGAAYLLYYRLMRDVGPTRTLTVTFLIPLFGMLWSALFLSETITAPMVGGCALIIGGTLFVLRRTY
ncbi:MAG: DMT family transporter [Betaproteobacteria bacterium]